MQRRFDTVNSVIWSCEVVMRTSVLRKIGGYRPEFPQAAALEMWMRTASVADVGYILGADQAYYRLHASNMHATMFDGRDLVGVLRYLQERRLIFRQAAVELDRDDGTVRAAERALAREALTLAARAYTFGLNTQAVADDIRTLLRALRFAPGPGSLNYATVENLVTFASAVGDPARALPEWHHLPLAHNIGQGRLPGNPTPILREVWVRSRDKTRMGTWRRLRECES